MPKTMSNEVLKLTLEELHWRISASLMVLNGATISGGEVDDASSDAFNGGRWTIADPDAENTPEQIDEFCRKVNAAKAALADLDSSFHDLWDCR